MNIAEEIKKTREEMNKKLIKESLEEIKLIIFDMEKNLQELEKDNEKTKNTLKILERLI